MESRRTEKREHDSNSLDRRMCGKLTLGLFLVNYETRTNTVLLKFLTSFYPFSSPLRRLTYNMYGNCSKVTQSLNKISRHVNWILANFPLVLQYFKDILIFFLIVEFHLRSFWAMLYVHCSSIRVSRAYGPIMAYSTAWHPTIQLYTTFGVVAFKW